MTKKNKKPKVEKTKIELTIEDMKPIRGTSVSNFLDLVCKKYLGREKKSSEWIDDSKLCVSSFLWGELNYCQYSEDFDMSFSAFSALFGYPIAGQLGVFGTEIRRDDELKPLEVSIEGGFIQDRTLIKKLQLDRVSHQNSPYGVFEKIFIDLNNREPDKEEDYNKSKIDISDVGFKELYDYNVNSKGMRPIDFMLKYNWIGFSIDKSLKDYEVSVYGGYIKRKEESK